MGGLTQEDMLQKLWTDTYAGEGKENPSITTRLALVEDILEKLSRNLNKLALLCIGTLLTVLGELAIKLVK